MKRSWVAFSDRHKNVGKISYFGVNFFHVEIVSIVEILSALSKRNFSLIEKHKMNNVDESFVKVYSYLSALNPTIRNGFEALTGLLRKLDIKQLNTHILFWTRYNLIWRPNYIIKGMLAFTMLCGILQKNITFTKYKWCIEIPYLKLFT